MSLKKPNTTADNSAFEVDPENETAAEQVTETVTEAAATTTAVAVAKPSALARPTAANIKLVNIMSDAQDAFRVEFDSLPGVKASQGQFMFKDTNEKLGDHIDIELISFQGSWVASPNDKAADVELVKYSDDGKVSKDGVDMHAHVADLKEMGYKNARLTQRCILVGELLAVAGKGSDRVGELVQIDLPDTGRKSFETYCLQASYAVGKGRKTAEQVKFLRLTGEVTTTKDKEDYTKVVIATMPVAA